MCGAGGFLGSSILVLSIALHSFFSMYHADPKRDGDTAVARSGGVLTRNAEVVDDPEEERAP